MADRDDGLGQRQRQFRRWHEGTAADLDVHDQRIEAGSQLLGQNGGRDQRDRLDRGGDVTRRVDALVGRRQVGGLADDRGAGLTHRGLELLRGGEGVVAGNRRELVQRTAGVPEATPRDHRVVAAASCEHRTEHQRHHVADPAGRMLVDNRTVEIERAPVHDAPRVAHRQRQVDALARRHAVEKNRHGEGSDLRLADAVVGDPADEGLNFGGRKGELVALVTDDFLRQQHDELP